MAEIQNTNPGASEYENLTPVNESSAYILEDSDVTISRQVTNTRDNNNSDSDITDGLDANANTNTKKNTNSNQLQEQQQQEKKPVPDFHNHFPKEITERYTLLRELGQGAYGYVCAAKNNLTGQEVAVKKITKIFEKDIFAKRALRELKLLKHFAGHENITSLIDMELSNPKDYNEIFLVQDLMEADLHQIIRSQQALSEQHFQFFIYQICKGLKYIHSASVLHRDLKPGNLLVNADCELKICDFGLARGFSELPDTKSGFMTEYVATRWYRAPEIMLSFKSYTKAIDVWSVGCIMAELLGGKPLFKGRDYVDQLNQILEVSGTPSNETLSRIGSERAIMYIRSLPYTPKRHLSLIFPDTSPEGLDLLDKLLQFDPANRITVDEALQHPWLEAYHEPEEEISHISIFDFSFESISSIEEMKKVIADEIMQFKTTAVALKSRAPLVLDVVDPASMSPDISMQGIQDCLVDLDEELRMKGMH